MSVINSVLRDLEAREARFTPIEIDTLEPAPASRGRRGPLLAAVALALLTGVAVWLLWRVPAPRGAEAIVPALEPAALAAVAEKPSPLVPRNRIVGLQLRESRDGLRLEFALRERPVAYLRHRDGNRYGYHLRAVDSDIEAPRIDAGDWFETLALDARDGGIDIDFVTAPGVLVETRQARADGEPVWAIQLRRAPAAVPAAAPPRAPLPAVAATDTVPVVAAASAAAAVTETAAATVAEAKPERETGAVVALAGPAPAIAPAEAGSAEVRLDIRSTDPAAPARNRLQYATELMNSGRFADAEALLEDLLDGPEDRAAREHLLALYQLRGRPRDLARLARASIERYPAAAVFATEYARVLMQSAAYAEVVALLSPASDLDADRQGLLAAAFQRLDRHADAVHHYRLAVAQDAANARHWIGLGISQEQVADLEDALNSYRMAARLGPPSERLRAFVAKRSDMLERVLN